MKYCFNYRRTSEVMHLLDEVNIKFDPKNLDVLFDYMLEHTYQRINAKFRNEDEIYSNNMLEKFGQFKVEHPEIDFTVILPKYNSNLAKICKQKDIKFFFDIVVRDWETLHCFLDLGASDVYLVEQMMFEIKSAAAAVHMAGAQVRTFPNIAQMRYEETSSLKSFFIRPEDVSLYEGLVDVMDIYTIDELNQDVVFDVYKNDKQWWGPLKELIVGLDTDLDGRYVIPRFGERRLACNRKCFKGSHCDVCDVCEQLARNMQKAGILIKYNKEEESDGKGTSSKSNDIQQDTK